MDTDGAAEENLLVVLMCLIVCQLSVCLISTVALSGLL